MKILILLLTAAGLQAAQPDWPRVEQHAVDLVQQYIRIRTIDPPANTAEAAHFFEAELERNGLTPKLYTSGPGGQTDLIVRLAGRDRAKKPLLLLNHFDVVPVDPRAWTMDPFAAVIKDGFLWGRGAYDMKGIGVQQLTTLILLKQLGIVPARDIVMLSTADEESSGIYGIQWMIAHHWDELNPEYSLDEGGLVSREML
ncbi:MAG: M20/M25/M40 family metallo-hydrolase, partial [Bryobacteraceae bacterium]